MKLLCLERTDGDLSGWAEALIGLGHEVTCTGDVGALLEATRTRRIEAALLPLEVEGGDAPGGAALLEELRRLWPSVPLIVFGVEDTARAAAEAAARGALGYLPMGTGGGEGPGGAPDGETLSLLDRLLRRSAARLRVEEDRRAALEETLRLRKFYGDVLNGVGQGIVVIDPQARIQFRNPAAAQLLGEEGGGVANGGPGAVALLQLLVETLTEGEGRSTTLALESDEQRVSLDVTTSILRGADGQRTGAVAIVSDRSIERNLEQQLFHTERLATLGSLLASIAHEINNPLTSITGCAEMGLELVGAAEEAAARATDPDSRTALEGLGHELRQVFDLMLEAGTIGQTIVNNMLQYSRQGAPSHRLELDLNELIERTLAVLGKHLGVEKVRLVLDLDPRRPRVRIEASKLQQALVNLIVNAVQALLALDVPHEQRELRLETRRDDAEGLALLRVCDRGRGIPPKHLERIFQPFFTTKSHGTGLGLHITRRVIEDQDGTIAVESVPGVGTTFSIRLPLA